MSDFNSSRNRSDRSAHLRLPEAEPYRQAACAGDFIAGAGQPTARRQGRPAALTHNTIKWVSLSPDNFIH